MQKWKNTKHGSFKIAFKMKSFHIAISL